MAIQRDGQAGDRANEDHESTGSCHSSARIERLTRSRRESAGADAMKKKPNIRGAFEEIDPAIAKRYLARNLANRHLRESTVRAFEIDMRAGNWVPTHQGIA